MVFAACDADPMACGLQRLGRRRQLRAVPSIEDDAGAGLCQAPCHGEAKATGGARDERRLAREVE